MTRDAALQAHRRSVVELAVADFLARTEIERLRLFREHLRTTVVQASPLLLELATMEGIDLGATFSLMVPPGDWPWRPMHEPANPVMRQWRARHLMSGVDAQKGAGRLRRAFADPGVVIRGVDHPRGLFAIRPAGSVLAFIATVGPCLLTAHGPIAMLRLPERLPETLMASMPGRRLGQLVDHPLFRDRDCKVRQVIVDPGDELPVLTFRVPLIGFELEPESAGHHPVWPEDGW